MEFFLEEMVGAVEIEATAATTSVCSFCTFSKPGGWGERKAPDTFEGKWGSVKIWLPVISSDNVHSDTVYKWSFTILGTWNYFFSNSADLTKSHWFWLICK